MKSRSALGLVLLLSACPADSSRVDGRPVPEALVRGCSSAVHGEPNIDNARIVGPFAVVGIREAANLKRSAFRERRGRLQAIKLLAVVMGPGDVTVTVPSEQREDAALLYDPDVRGSRFGYLFSEGTARVLFRGCPSGDAQYNGGILARRPTCVRLLVRAEGSAPGTARIPLGLGTACPT